MSESKFWRVDYQGHGGSSFPYSSEDAAVEVYNRRLPQVQAETGPYAYEWRRVELWRFTKEGEETRRECIAHWGAGCSCDECKATRPVKPIPLSQEPEAVRARVLQVVTALNKDGTGVRTTEVDAIARGAQVDEQSASNAIWALLQDRKLRCVTESYIARGQSDREAGKRYRRVRGDYCWIVPADWQDRPLPGYLHVPKTDIYDLDEVWDLYPEPTNKERS